MKIGILGGGRIGGTMGRRWAEAGHDVMFGSRDPHNAKVRDLIGADGVQAQLGTVAEAIAFGDVILLSTPADAARDVVTQGASWQGKILIDATNRFNPPTPSLSEELAQWAAGSRVVKAFNTAGFEVYADPRFGDQTADLYLCGDDTAAKQVVAGLASSMGLTPVDVGPLSNATLLDNLARLWISLMRSQGRGLAFKLMRR